MEDPFLSAELCLDNRTYYLDKIIAGVAIFATREPYRGPSTIDRWLQRILAELRGQITVRKTAEVFYNAEENRFLAAPEKRVVLVPEGYRPLASYLHTSR